ncbi:endothelin-converting enzyme 2, partial [Biomphalaria glabrata]
MISFKMWMLFLLASHYVTNVTGMSSTQNNMQSVCQTKDCRLGQQIARMMDTRVDPCEDMYQFSCGGWIRDNPLPDDTKNLTLIDKLESQNRKEMIQFLESDDVKCLNSTAVEKLRTIFKTCVKTEPNDALLYKSLVNYIDYIGSWTVTPTPGGWNEASWSLQQALEKSHSLWGNSFWTYFISRRILNVRQNGLMNEVQTKTNGNPFDDPAFKEAFMNETVPFALLLGGEEQTARDKLEVVYEFQKNLSKIFRPADLKVEASNITSVKKMTVGEFQTLLGSWIDVDKYFSAVVGQTFVTKDDEMNVIDFDYFKRLGYIIQETDKEVLANYIVYNFVKLARSYFPSFMPTNGNSRTEECFELLERNDLVCPLDSLFVKKHLSPQLHSKVALIVNGLEHQFVKTFENSDWMDSKDKSELISRLKFMDILIGGEDWITDLVKIDQRYEALDAVEGDYLQNRANIVRFRKNKKARSLPEKLVLFSSYHPYLEYEANYNALKLHAGILMEPLASASYP